MTVAEPASQQQQGKLRPYLTFWGMLACVLTTAVVIIGLGGLFILHMVDVKFLKDVACQDFGSSSLAPKFSYCFYSSEWDDETYLAAITSFYNTLITVLIALQALISWVSFIVIRNSNKQEIESEVEKELPNFFRNKNSDAILREALKENLQREVAKTVKEGRDSEDNAIEELQQSVYDELLPQFSDLKAKIEQLDVRMRKIRKGDEDDDGETNVDLGRIIE